MSAKICFFCGKDSDEKRIWPVGKKGICKECAASLREALGNNEVEVIMDLPTLITDREFADLLKLSPKNGWQTIQQWARKGKLKKLAVRVGDKWRFKKDGVCDWIQRGGMQS